MTSKIQSLDQSKEENEHKFPIELDEILQKLKAIPSDILEEYTGTIQTSVEDLLFCKNVISARDSPNLFKHLTEGLTQKQLERFSHIASYLSAEDCLKKTKEIIAQTFGNCAATPENLAKSTEFIDWIKSLKMPNCKEKSEEILRFSNNLRTLADILILLNEDNKFCELLVNRLSESHFDQLDCLIEIGHAFLSKTET